MFSAKGMFFQSKFFRLIEMKVPVVILAEADNVDREVLLMYEIPQ